MLDGARESASHHVLQHARGSTEGDPREQNTDSKHMSVGYITLYYIVPAKGSATMCCGLKGLTQEATHGNGTRGRRHMCKG